MKAGFSEFDITPPLGTKKVGWMEDLTAEVVLDPLGGRVAIFANDTDRVAFIQLDLLSLRWTQVSDIRQRVARAYGFPGDNIMIACTHNHAGPATTGVAPLPRDEGYIESLTQNCVAAFGEALGRLQEARVGYGTTFGFQVAHNRRTMFRDGIVRSQAPYNSPLALGPEGPIDPQVAVLAVQDLDGHLLGCLVNFACHPVHHGGTNEISAGFPGVVASLMKEAGCPVTLYLSGAYGNLISSFEKEEIGQRLFADVQQALSGLKYEADAVLGAAHSTLDLEYRNITDDEYHGRVIGAQRFRSDKLYEDAIDHLLAQIKAGKRPKAEVQVLRVGEWYFAGIPAEYFVEHGLRIKLQTHPRYALVVAGANGMLGYVPTVQAFAHGGYETTLGPPSRMAPETGDLLADEAIRLIASM